MYKFPSSASRNSCFYNIFLIVYEKDLKEKCPAVISTPRPTGTLTVFVGTFFKLTSEHFQIEANTGQNNGPDYLFSKLRKLRQIRRKHLQ